MASLSLVLAAYVLFFALPVVLPKGGYLLVHGVVTGGLLALLLFGGEAGAGGPTRPLSEAVYLLFWLVTLSGVAARRLPPSATRGSRSSGR